MAGDGERVGFHGLSPFFALIGLLHVLRLLLTALLLFVLLLLLPVTLILLILLHQLLLLLLLLLLLVVVMPWAALGLEPGDCRARRLAHGQRGAGRGAARHVRPRNLEPPPRDPSARRDGRKRSVQPRQCGAEPVRQDRDPQRAVGPRAPSGVRRL
jgi:hypothetical protein